MFYRLLFRAATVRRGRTLTALLAMTVAACLATALLDVYADIGAKLSGDFRKFGANVIVTAADGFSSADIDSLQRQAGEDALLLPEALAIAKTDSGRFVVVVGTDFSTARKMNSWWAVSQWPNSANEALAGERMSLQTSAPVPLEFSGKHLTVAPVSQLRTGGDDDNRIYISLPEFQQWTGLKPTVVEIALPGSPTDVNSAISRMQRALPKSMTVQPVRQIVAAEARVLGKTRFILLLSTIAITLTVALCVLATLTASVLERRKDYAVMKALGSSQRALNAIFLGEALSLAIVGAIIGFAAGCGLAMWIGRANFHAAVEPQLTVFPPVFVGCLAIAAISAILPLGLLQKTEPAAMLKGE
jgi:putative ABC transport system permease protein